MFCRLADMREKQVVCIKDGAILGFVNDVEMDTETGRLISVVIYGKRHFFGLLGRDNDFRIPWESIEVMGEDSILVDFEGVGQIKRRKSSFFNEIFAVK